MPVEPLTPERLYRRCDPASLGFATTRELDGERHPALGQARAEEALSFGTSIRSAGFNLFALGPNALGKFTMIRRFLERKAADAPVPDDWCYVYNFKEAHKPKALRLPPGKAQELRTDMERLIEETQSSIRAVFESDDYRHRREAIDEEFRERQSGNLERLQEQAREKNVALVRTPMGLALAPMRDGEVISPDVFRKLPREEQQRTEQDIEALQQELRGIMEQMPDLDRERRKRIHELDKEVTLFAVSHPFEAMRTKYADLPGVVLHLNAVRDDLVEHAPGLLRASEEEKEREGPQMPQMPPALKAMLDNGSPRLRRYQVNVLVSRQEGSGAPVVYEDNPTFPNLIGRIEHIAEMGALITDFTLIKSGSLQRANGGYLIVDARKLLMQPFAWDSLKRALKSRELRIESPTQAMSFITTITLDPEAVPLDVKVVLLGDRELYYLLAAYEPEFRDLFKVEVDFAEDMDRSDETARTFAVKLAALVREKGLRPLTADAVARTIEHASRLAADSEKLSIHMGALADVLCEADFWAGEAGREAVRADDITRAINAQIRRADRIRERAHEAILRETLLIDTSGAKVGQVNGLAVLSLGTFAFGRPNRISARVRMGRGEVVDIEREVALGGPLHSKGVLILSGYVASRFAPKHPLSLQASLVFEQSYGGVDGDSASSAELYALLSALAEVPIRQGFAVTGSVNQYGEVQAIGGVNEKIEGFFDICAKRGLTGEQGVLIPAANVKHLMLRPDVVEAVAQGRFAIYPVASIDAGIEILTGVPAGDRGADGAFPDGTVNARVEARLIALAEARKAFGGAGRQEGGT